MNSEKVLAENFIFRKFVLAVLLSMRRGNFDLEERSVIHSDFVPKVSERVMRASFRNVASSKLSREISGRFDGPARVVSTIGQKIDGYRKIIPLLNDPSVSVIECEGAGKQVTVIRQGRKQFTRIVLSAVEIDDFLNKMSEKSHIPLLEGVFRVAVDNFSVSAVISKMIGSKFVLRKV